MQKETKQNQSGKVKVYVNIISPRGSAKRFPVETTPIYIGREPGIQVQVNDGLCSSKHAILYTRNNELYIEDLNSKNGVVLNGVKILKQRVFLDDQLTIGNTRIEIDREKNGPEVLNALTPEEVRQNGNITLELETHQSLKENQAMGEAQRQFVRQSKLYHGAGEAVNARAKNELGERLKDWIALTLDVLISFVVLGLTHLIFKNVAPETEPLFFLLGGALAGFLFFRWNRNQPKGSLGEKLIGHD